MYYFILCSLNLKQSSKLRFKSLRAAKSWFARGDKDLKDRLSIFIDDDGKIRMLTTRGVNDKSWVNYENYKDEFKHRFK